MKTETWPFLESVKKRWSEIAASRLSRGLRSQVSIDNVAGKLKIELESAKHVALIEAWENAHCLDVTVIPVATGESKVLAAGPCADERDLESRLLAASRELKKI